ncbi:MAG: DUF5916 domain-containing protein [Gemmatimonadales bacterium]
MRAFALLFQIATTPLSVNGQGAPTVTIPRIEAAPAIDGTLDEAVWQQATRLTGFWEYQPADGRPAGEETEVRVWYSSSAIYFGIIAHDRDPGSIRATVADRDNIQGDDNVRIYLDTFNDRRRAYFFGVNPLGAQEDGVRAEGGFTAGSITGGTTDLNPDFLWESKGHLTPEGYVVEIRIPFKSLRFRGDDPKSWGIQIVRTIQRTGYQESWTDLRRANASFLLQDGTIAGIHGIHRGVVVEAQPTITGSVSGTRDTTTGAFTRGAERTDIGGNLKLGFNSFSIDATANPDFSQVESDAGQVTVNQRFALFFPEKRPFFLEGIELFATPNQLVYTRQIGNPIGGIKVAGKIGNFTIAHLTALDETGGGASNALFDVGRIRADFGENSTAGLTYTDRSAGSEYNRVVAADVRYVFGKLYYFQSQFGGSWTRDSAGSRSSPIWLEEFDRTGRQWGFNYQVTGIGAGFDARAGYVPRTDIVQAHGFNRFTWYGKPGATIESFTTFFGPEATWNYDGFSTSHPVEGDQSITNMFRFRGGWNLTITPKHAFVLPDPALYTGYTVDHGVGGIAPYIPPGTLDGWQIHTQLSTPVYRGFNADATVLRGTAVLFAEGSLGRELTLQGDLSLRPSQQVRLTCSLIFDRLTRARNGAEFARTVIPRLRVDFQPLRSLFFRVIGEYQSARVAALADPATGDPILVNGVPASSSETNTFRMDWLASFQPNPGTVAFLGYGSTLDGGLNTLTFSRLVRTDDGFFVKFAYLFRR